MEKKIKYTARDFEAIKSELLAFSKKYYPELSDNWNDASIGAWLIDLVSSVGDSLNYNMDRIFQETNINSANSKSSVLNSARLNGVKIPGPKASMCEVELSCILPSNGTDSPDWDYAPLVKMGSIVGNMDYYFEIMEDVDFGVQFNNDGYSNRKYQPRRDNNGNIQDYIVTKNVLVTSGKSKVYKKVISEDELVPFMEIVLPEKGIMNVESIIFKETNNLVTDPQIFEYFIDAEEYKLKGQSIKTYRYFEVNSLSDQFRFGNVANIDDNKEVDPFDTVDYEDYTEGSDLPSSQRTTRYYKGKWHAITQKFITEYTDNDYLKIIFGGASEINETPLSASKYATHMMSKIINNPMLGLLPKAGWTMYVLYRTGGGADTNLAQGAINSIINLNVVFPNLCVSDSVQQRTEIGNSFKVYNPTTTIGGKNSPSIDEIKYLTKYATSAQERCVTLKDYKARVMQIPPKYGCPYRLSVVEDNNKISMAVLHLTPDGKLTTVLPKLLADNIKEYLKHYKSLTDYVEIRSGKYYNLGFDIDVFVDKNYTTSDVIKSIIAKVTDYMDISKHDMGEDIFLGDLEKEITTLDGVLNLINMNVYGLSGMGYGEQCPLPTIGQPCAWQNNATSEAIDTVALDKVLYSDVDSMWEIRYPDKDIRVRVKLR